MILSHRLSLLPVGLFAGLANSLCPPAGPLLPPPNLSNASAVAAAGNTLKSLLDNVVNGSSEAAGWRVNETSFSVIFGYPGRDVPIWEYHHEATVSLNGSQPVGRDTSYLVASNTKVFTTLLLLKSGIELDSPITKFLPQLANTSSAAKWGDITIRDLGDHLSALQPSYGFPEIYTLQAELYPQIGFPVLNASDYPSCGIIGLNQGCTKEQLLAGLLNIHPVYPPHTQPSYSTISFALLGFVLEQVTGKSYSQLLQEEILDPLEMGSSALSPNNKTAAVIPPTMNSWGAEFNYNSPGSGLVSTPGDMLKFTNGVLSHKIISESLTNAWLKPNSAVRNLNSLVGFPWEIVRSANLTPPYPHLIDIYAKDGGVYGYGSRTALIPEYNISFVILTAGDAAIVNPLVEATLATFMPAIENTTRSAAKVYTGTYASAGDVSANMTLDIDNGPGLLVDGLFRNETSLLESIAKIRQQNFVGTPEGELEFRLYPNGISRADGNSTLEEWRLWVETKDQKYPSSLPSAKVYEHSCQSYLSQDLIYYGGLSVERFVIRRVGDIVVEIESPALRTNFTKLP